MAFCQLHQRKAQFRDSGGVPSALALKPHNLLPPSVSLEPPELPSFHQNPGWVPESESLYMGPLRGHQGFQLPSFLPRDEIPTHFSQILRGFTDWNRCSGLGSHVWRLGPLASQGETSIAKKALLIFNHHTLSVGPAHFASLPPFSVSTWLVLYTLSHRTFVQVVFRWFSRLNVLQFSCNLMW